MLLKTPWKQALKRELRKPYFIRLKRWIEEERKTKQIYPADEHVFAALNYLKPKHVKCVIIGQDPYHNDKATGLAFSTPPNRGLTPSLHNIFKELKEDLGYEIPNHGFLSQWAARGVLLLNSVLTVEDGFPGSHRGRGWEEFTDRIVSWLNKNKKPIVFMLWGLDAMKKKHLIKNPKHLVLQSSHPSPFSAWARTTSVIPFMGSKPFSQANEHLKKFKRRPIDWQIDNKR